VANSRMRIGAKLTNFKEMATLLEALPPAIATNVMGVAIDQAASPIERNAKDNAPENRGALKKSITRVVRKYPGSKVPAIAIIGPDKNFTQSRLQGGRDLKGYDRPSKTAHLVEFGHYTRAEHTHSREAASKVRRFTARERQKANAAGVALPAAGRSTVIFVPPNPFLRNAVRDGEAESARGFEDGCVKGLERETKKLSRKIIKAA
jgi:hypothetical protein